MGSRSGLVDGQGSGQAELRIGYTGPKRHRITQWLSLRKPVPSHHPSDTTQKTILLPKPLINEMTPSSS